MGILNVGGEAEYERKRQKLTAKYKAEFAAYECDRDRGTKQFTIEYDDQHKCAEVVLAYILTSYPASRAYGIYAGRRTAVGSRWFQLSTGEMSTGETPVSAKRGNLI